MLTSTTITIILLILSDYCIGVVFFQSIPRPSPCVQVQPPRLLRLFAFPHLLSPRASPPPPLEIHPTSPSPRSVSQLILPPASLPSSPHMATVEVDSQDMIRLILQFCRENNLNATMAALQSESQVLLHPGQLSPAPYKTMHKTPK